MSENPLISIIIPVYNIVGRLPVLLDDLKRQDYDNLELIVFDDCSDDTRGGETIKEYLSRRRFAQYTLLRGESNRGVAFARNRGLEAAQGEFVAFVDGDDRVERNYISSLYRTLCSVQSDYASCGYVWYDEIKHLALHHPLNVRDAAPESVLCARILNTCEISHIASLFKKDFLTRYGLKFPEGCSAGEDMEFILKFLCHGRGAFIPDCLYTYVQHDLMGSRKNVIDKEKKYCRYRDHAYAQIRQACYIIHHAEGKPRRLAQNMLFPNACQCLLSAFAMEGNRARYDKLLASERLRQNLWAAWRSFLYKPERFIRSLFALFFPGFYWMKYSRYL